ncbi:FliH/SctL family protein [Aliiroseovarius halocynthiae]|uniref:Flagellar biosynthesis protein n=1 Tax=Aliiroseovarius halocynthiae TaxID=985055 RepID=A0A545SYI0_9RHOB|nr:flagellar biosynthesis protein [Aliiroseovarius halocynthiae]TQV70024.1 flagellar biosynthesis protein [Aliiroseovarius halocynthiae]
MRYALEDFGDVLSSAGQADANPEVTLFRSELDARLEARKLEGYEAGYQSGWDDAVKSMDEDNTRVRTEFARNLEDLGFTYQEARSHVLTALEPLLTQMLEAVLPTAVERSLGPIVAEAMMPLASELADAPIDVLVSPGSRATLEAFLADARAVPFQILEKDTLLDGQIYLRSGENERRVDLSAAIERITQAVSALYHVNERAFDHG